MIRSPLNAGCVFLWFAWRMLFVICAPNSFCEVLGDCSFEVCVADVFFVQRRTMYAAFLNCLNNLYYFKVVKVIKVTESQYTT